MAFSFLTLKKVAFFYNDLGIQDQQYCIMRLSRQFQACLFFFDEKILCSQKYITLRSFCAREKLLPLLFSVSLFLFCQLIFDCEVFLCARNLFVKKKKKLNRLEIVLITSLYNTTFLEIFSLKYLKTCYMCYRRSDDVKFVTGSPQHYLKQKKYFKSFWTFDLC